MPDRQTSQLTFHVTITVLALAVFSAAMILGFGLLATLSADRDALAKQQTFVANGIREQMATLKREQQSVTVWDDSVIHAKANDQKWMAENLGEWMFSYYSHDRVYILDHNNNPIYAMRDGKSVDSARYRDDELPIFPVLQKIRTTLKAEPGQEAPGDAITQEVASVEGRPAIVSIAPIVPNTPLLTRAPDQDYLHVSVRFMDGTLVDKIAEQYLLSAAQFSSTIPTASAQGSIALTNSTGLTLGYIVWNRDRPGLTLVRKTSPALAVGAVLALSVLFFLLRRLRRSSSQLQLSQDQAQYLAFHDTLTGLPNRALFDDRLKRALLTVKRDKSKIALLYIDLDRFKHVNDTLGHPAGDELVKQTAARLEATIREVDTVARLGGDEFAVILIGVTDVRAAEDVCEHILREIGRPFNLMDDEVFVSASIGIAIAPDFGAEPSDLLRKADIALYEAKKGGRGRHQVFAGDMDDIISRRRMIESELRQALVSGNQLSLRYQPIYATDCTTILGTEALIRWDHPIHGALSPAHFIGIAEERGMISLLGDWVLREATRFTASTTLSWVAVNISPLQLRDENFPAHVLEILAQTGLAPNRLQIEITEGVLLENTEVMRATLATLRAAGIRIALDDFGTGYSSVNYLRHYTIDKLKIDRSFVRLLGADDGASAITKALVDLAAALNIQVTAEGVETPDQRDLLIGMGCHELQGFLLSVPLSAPKVRQLIDSSFLDHRQEVGATASQRRR